MRRSGDTLVLASASRRLGLDGTLNSLNSATELGQNAVPRGVSDPASMSINQSVKDDAPLGQSLKGSDLVSLHQTAISLDVSRKNRDQPALRINRFRQEHLRIWLLVYRGRRGQDTQKIAVSTMPNEPSIFETRQFRDVRTMSAFPLIPTKSQARRHVV